MLNGFKICQFWPSVKSRQIYFMPVEFDRKWVRDSRQCHFYFFSHVFTLFVICFTCIFGLEILLYAKLIFKNTPVLTLRQIFKTVFHAQLRLALFQIFKNVFQEKNNIYWIRLCVSRRLKTTSLHFFRASLPACSDVPQSPFEPRNLKLSLIGLRWFQF